MCPLLLAACSLDPLTADSYQLARDSELCRAAVADQLSRERTSFTLRSDVETMVHDQRYYFCMTDKGYTLPEPRIERSVLSDHPFPRQTLAGR